MSAISRLIALEILDSRGNPTLQATCELESGCTASAKVPSGASTGINEAVELRDGDPERYGGKGVLTAVANVNSEINSALTGMDPGDQRAVDSRLTELDGTDNKGRLGANAILGASLAVARANAKERSIPLFEQLSPRDRYTLPVPMFNILNGGQHADNNVDIQEFMVLPVGLPTFRDALRSAAEIFQTLKGILKGKGYNTAVGDEGGFAPQLRSNEEPMELLVAAIEKAGYAPGSEVYIGLDAAASEFCTNGMYVFDQSDGSSRDPSGMAAMWEDWAGRYPLLSLEDGFSEVDHAGWKIGTDRLGQQLQLVGDDLFVTNPRIFASGIADGLGNSILIKLNQIGTLTETLDCIQMARDNGYTFIISHRSGETADTTIADLAVSSGSGQIKTGSTCRSDRVAKYNRLLEIEAALGPRATYAGRDAFQGWL